MPPSTLCASHLFYVPGLLQPPTENAPYPNDLHIAKSKKKTKTEINKLFLLKDGPDVILEEFANCKPEKKGSDLYSRQV